MPKLQKFKKNNTVTNPKYLFSAFAIILGVGVAVIISRSYALYKEEQQYDVIKSKIGTWLYAKNLIYDNTNSGSECTDVECALDELYEKFE